MSAPVLTLRNVAYVAGGARVLDRIDLELAEGQRLAVVGANGSGKSLLAAIAGALTAPSQGSVALFGVETGRLEPEALRSLRGRVGMAMQGGSLMADLDVESNLRLGLRALSGAALDRARRRLDRILLDFALDHLYARPVEDLSAGEQRRVELARAFLRDPDLLILDDPFEGADAATAADLRERVGRMLKRRPRAVLLLTHDEALATELCGSSLRLRNGRLD